MGARNGKPVLRPEDVAAFVKISNLNEAQVKQYFEDFMQDNPDGKMKPNGIREMMAKAMSKKDAQNMEQHIFKIYDTNNDGYIDFNEFMLVVFIMSSGTPEEALTSIFRMFDLNSDGTITQKEMTKLIKDMYCLLKEEDPNLAAEDLVAKSAFAEMDADQDGKVTMAEFIAACLGQEELSKMLALKAIDIIYGQRRLEEQIKQYFDDFVQEHPDGKIKPKDFHKMMAKALPKKDAGKMEQHVFRIYETNNDGFIDFWNIGTPEEVFTSIFRMFDVNNDGTITQKEMTKLIQDMYYLLNEEDPNHASKDLLAKSAFAEMDTDQDGKVIMAEFIAAFLGQEELSKMLTFKVMDILYGRGSQKEAQLKQYIEAFVQEHPDGKIKPTEFHEMMEKALPNKDAGKLEQHVFRIYDTNNDGFIDFWSDGTPEEVLTSIFCMLDVNKDGTITQKEMTKLIEDMYGLLKEDDPNLAAKDLLAKSAIAEMDADQDGKVTMAEFINAFLGQEKLSKMLTFKVMDILYGRGSQQEASVKSMASR